MLAPSYHQVIDSIAESLFGAEKRRFAKAIETFVQLNQESHRLTLDGFNYNGKFYRPEGLRGPMRQKFLHENLHAQMNEHLADEDKVTSDEREIRQILFKLLDPCRTHQDVRDTLPECIVYTLGEPNPVRTRQEAFTLKDDERGKRQYADVLPLIQLYATARLLY